jgi:hypothetical protein
MRIQFSHRGLAATGVRMRPLGFLSVGPLKIVSVANIAEGIAPAFRGGNASKA